MFPQNLGSLFRNTVQRYGSKRALLYKINEKYASLSWNETSEKVIAVALNLIALGLKPGDRIALLSENRPEWLIMDIAAQSIGLVTVPIYTSLAPAEIEYILNDCHATVIALSGKNLFEKVAAIESKIPHVKHLIGFDTALSLYASSTAIPMSLFRDMVKTVGGADLMGLYDRIPAESVASIIYTSGTTGMPKGVMLTHANFIHNVVLCREALKMSESDTHLSFLPLSHVFERTAGHFLMIYIGATIAYAESMETVPLNLSETHPTFLLGVPRFYEKIKTGVEQALKKASPVKKALFFWAKELGERRRAKERRADLFLPLKEKIADKLVYSAFRKRLGGKIRFCISGGAPIARDTVEFFYDLGVMIYEGYGLTETSPVIAANSENKWRFGTVGLPLPGVAVRIADDGEILTKGPCVMKGYYNKPDETQAAIRDGWFHTGDLGKIDKDGFLSITGRKKEIIITSGGKKIAPRFMEELLERDAFILRCVLFGEGRKFITALLVPKREEILRFAEDSKIVFSDYEALLKNPIVQQALEIRVQKYMVDFASYEKIKYFALLDHDFSQEAGELTPTLKIKREVIWSRYKDMLLPLYDLSAGKD